MSFARAACLALSLALWVSVPSYAAAQVDCRDLPMPAEGDAEATQHTALEAFSRGSHATEEERWDGAERCFGIAWRLSHVALARYNQAVAMRALGRYREARDAFDEALAAGLDPDRTAQATAMRAEVTSSVASLRIEGLSIDAAELELDGDAVPRDPGSVTLVECDPGRHTLIVRAPGYTPFTWSGDVTAGDTSVAVALEHLPSGGGGVLDEPWFWVVVGVVVVGVAIGVGIYAQDQAQLRGEAAPGFVVRL